MRISGILGPILTIGLTAGCAMQQPQPVQSSTPPAETKADERDVVVYFLPLDDFNVEASASLARHFSEEFGVRMRSALPMGSRELRPFEGTQQYAAEDILSLAASVLARLPTQAPDASYVILTNRDINARARTFRYMFSWHDSLLRASVVSTARLAEPGDSSPRAASLLADRLGKMVRRAIGELQFGWKRSGNIDDAMYSPLMGIEDLDRIGRMHTPD